MVTLRSCVSRAGGTVTASVSSSPHRRHMLRPTTRPVHSYLANIPRGQAFVRPSPSPTTKNTQTCRHASCDALSMKFSWNQRCGCPLRMAWGFVKVSILGTFREVSNTCHVGTVSRRSGAFPSVPFVTVGRLGWELQTLERQSKVTVQSSTFLQERRSFARRVRVRAIHGKFRPSCELCF